MDEFTPQASSTLQSAEFLDDFLAIKFPPSGIRNGFNLCYSTAAINAVLSVKSFRAQIFSPHRCRDSERACVTCSLQRVVKQMMRRQLPQNPATLISHFVPKNFTKDEQHDSNEFLQLLVGQLNEESERNAYDKSLEVCKFKILIFIGNIQLTIYYL